MTINYAVSQFHKNHKCKQQLNLKLKMSRQKASQLQCVIDVLKKGIKPADKIQQHISLIHRTHYTLSERGLWTECNCNEYLVTPWKLPWITLKENGKAVNGARNFATLGVDGIHNYWCKYFPLVNTLYVGYSLTSLWERTSFLIGWWRVWLCWLPNLCSQVTIALLPVSVCYISLLW